MTTTEKQQLVIIGNGMAAGRLLSEMLHLGMDEYAVSVFDQESHGSYNRIMLSPVLAGEMEISEIITHPEAWYAEHNITLHSNDPIVSVDKQAKTVTSETGKTVAYDKLVFATGSDPILPPNVRECPYTGITSFRNLKDVQAIKEQAAVSKHALVIGGGLLGLEAAYGLRKQGIEVSVVNRAPWLLNRQLDEHSGNLLQAELEGRGI
ncbi:MAG: NAD(P)/FAD-dependent oxidoreductase, partial [Pontibacterium sp.]